MFKIVGFLFAVMAFLMPPHPQPQKLLAQVDNPYYLVAKRNNNGSNYIRLSWKADRRDLTVRNLVTFNGSSTVAGIGASSFDSSVTGRTAKYLDDLAATFNWHLFAISGGSARNWIPIGQYVDPARNIAVAINLPYNTGTIKEHPKVMIVQDASNWVADGTSNATNLLYIERIVNNAVQAGAQVFLLSPQPRDTYTTSQRQQIEDFYNALVAKYVTAKVPNVRFVKVYDTLVTQPAKTIKTAFAAGDGIHLNNAGHAADAFRLKQAIDSVFAITSGIARHEIEMADSDAGPWTSYNNNIHPDTGFINLPMTYQHKYFRQRTVYSNGDFTAWSVSPPAVYKRGTLTPMEVTTGIFNQHNGFYRYLPDGYPEAGKKYPIIFFLHGQGEKGNGIPGSGLPVVLNQGIPRFLNEGGTMSFTVNGVAKKFIVIAPQLPSAQNGWTNQWIDPLITWAKANLNVDTTQMFLTGLSLGGGGVYRMITTDSTHAKQFAAASPVSATCDYLGTCIVADSKLPVWMFIDDNDTQVGTACNTSWVTAVNGCANIQIPVIQKLYSGLGHSQAAWDNAYDTGHAVQYTNMYEWFLNYTRDTSGSSGGGSTPPPTPPATKVFMGYLTAGYADENLVCSQTTYVRSIYGDDAQFDVTDNFYQDPYGTIFNGNLLGYGFSATGTGTPAYRLVLGAGPDAGHPNHAWRWAICNPNTPPSCDAGNPNLVLTLPTNSVKLLGSGSDVDGTVTYLWSRVSGPSFSADNLTFQQPTLSNLQQGTYVFRLTVKDDANATCSDDVTITVNAVNPVAPVKLIRFDMIDLDAIAMDEMGSGFQEENWFNGFASHDPRNNGSSLSDTIGHAKAAYPFRHFHYPKDLSDLNGKTLYRGDRGARMIWDMVGDVDPFKISTKVRITDIYGLQQGGDYLDTLIFINFDKVMEQAPVDRWKYIARPDSLLVPFAKLVQGSPVAYRPEWTSVSGINDSMRYVMVIMKKRQRAGYETFPNFSELVVYGKKLYSDAAVQVKNMQYTGPYSQTTTVDKHVGVNNVGVLLSQLKYDAVSREYISAGSYDSDTAAYPLNKINPNPFNFSTQYWNENFKQAANEGRIWWETARAGSKRLEKYGWGDVAKSLPVTEGGMEPESPYSYDRFGNLAYHYAAIFGHNPNHVDASFRWTNKSQLPGYGLGLRSQVEWGNEDETRGSTALASVIKENVMYDGWEGRIPNAGMKLGDSTMKLIMPATVYIDTGRYKAMIFLCKILRNDRKVIWDVFNGHHYSRSYDPRVIDHDPTYEEQVGVFGARAEWDRMRHRIMTAINVIMRETGGDTTKKFALTEWGYDNWATPSKSVADLTFGPPYYAIWTISGIPRKPGGQDSLIQKGILMVRGESWFCSTPMPYYNEYMITNNFFDPDNNFPGLFARSGRGAASIPGGPQGSNIEIPTKFPNYWARASFYQMMTGYRVDSVISEDSIGLCMLRWRNVYNPKLAVFEVWKGTWNNTTLPNTVLNLGPVLNNLAVRKTLSFTNAIPNFSNVNLSANGIFTTTVTEEPAFYFVTQTDYTPPPVTPPPVDTPGRLPLNRPKIKIRVND